MDRPAKRVDEDATVKKRVVHITSLGCSAKSFLLEHFRLLCQEGFEVILICSDDKEARYSAEITGAVFVPITIKQNISPFSDLVSLFLLWQKLRQIKPVIVDAHMSKAGLIGSLAALFARVPIRIYHNHGMALLSARGWKYWLLRLVESITCRCATEVIFVSHSNKDDITSMGICPKEKAKVLGPGTICGVDTEKFVRLKAKPRGVKLQQEAGIPDGKHIVGFVNRIVPHKGVETILIAWRLLPEEVRSSAYLCFFGGLGDSRMLALVEQAASVPDLHVKYMGFSYDMPAWYSVMTLLVQPSWHEGWGYSVLEAACCGVPAVGTRISATVDAIVDGETGILVQVRDPKEMSKAIAMILKDDTLRKKLGEAARKRSVSIFSKEKICPLLIEEYERLLR